MIELLKPWVVNIICIIIFITITDIILPEGSMRRYIRVIIGIFVLLAIIKPLLHIKDIKNDFEKSYVGNTIILDRKGAITDNEVMSKFQKIKGLEIYEKNLVDQIATAISYKNSIDKNSIKVVLDVNKDEKNNDFGLLNNVQVTIGSKKDKNKIEKIKKVEIGKEETVIYRNDQEYNFNDKTSSNEIRDMLSKMLGIDKNKILVKMTVGKE